MGGKKKPVRKRQTKRGWHLRDQIRSLKAEVVIKIVTIADGSSWMRSKDWPRDEAL